MSDFWDACPACGRSTCVWHTRDWRDVLVITGLLAFLVALAALAVIGAITVAGWVF